MGKRTRFTNVYGGFAIFVINPQNIKKEMVAFLVYLCTTIPNFIHLNNNNKINKLSALMIRNSTSDFQILTIQTLIFEIMTLLRRYYRGPFNEGK